MDNGPRQSTMATTPREGFVHKGKIVFALEYELATEPPSWLIVWLCPFGKRAERCLAPA